SRWLYLHGFASGPDSFKGVALSNHYQQRGVTLDRLNLRVPSFEELRLSAMMHTVRDAIGGPEDRAVLFGSSLGALTACRVAEQDPRVCALVLMAPAFRIMERWRARLGREGWERWEERGWLEVEDYAEKRTGRVDFGFALDAEAIDGRGDGWPHVFVPTLIIHGVRDEVASVELSRQFAAGKRHITLVEV